MAEVDPELEDILRQLSDAGLIVITNDPDGAERWTLGSATSPMFP
jgi:hypothetical protein